MMTSTPQIERIYDLRELEAVDFIVVPFSKWQGLAHTFLSFRFAGDKYVAVSVEVRKSQGQVFSPWKGLFRNYELIYVIGEERDLLALRTNILRHPVSRENYRVGREGLIAPD